MATNAFFSEKVHLLLFFHTKIDRYICFGLFGLKSFLVFADFSADSDELTFSLERAILWIEDSFDIKNFLTDLLID